MKYVALLSFCMLSSFAFSQILPEKRTIVLKNDRLELHIDLPGSGYHFSRFDHTGKITLLRYKNMLLTGSESPDQPDSDTMGKGFYNEFGIFEAIGFDSIREGDWFPKIGVGLLQKNSPNYRFNEAYIIQPADFTVIPGEDHLILSCSSRSVSGYAYHLEKEIRLQENGFIIRYRLHNTGTKIIQTQEYTHNFISLNSRFTGPDYRLILPMIAATLSPGNQVNPEGLVHIGTKDITFSGKPEQQFYFGDITAGTEVPAGWELQNTADGIGIRENGNFMTRLINLWGSGHVISPEVFIDLSLKPGESKEWSRIYTVFELK